MLDWPFEVDPRFALGAFAASIAVLALSAILVPVVLARLPADYFVRPEVTRRRAPWLTALRTAAGGVLVLAGIAMLVLPGQGVLTILAGLSLLPFRGKRRLERWLLARGPIRRLTRTLRARRGLPPLVLDPDLGRGDATDDPPRGSTPTGLR